MSLEPGKLTTGDTVIETGDPETRIQTVLGVRRGDDDSVTHVWIDDGSADGVVVPAENIGRYEEVHYRVPGFRLTERARQRLLDLGVRRIPAPLYRALTEATRV